MAEDADDPAYPALLPVGTDVVWTYLVRDLSTTSLTITSITDDNGTPLNLADDFHPVYVDGDTNNNRLLDPDEVWLYTSQGVTPYQASTALFGNVGTVTATAAGQTVTARDSAYLQGYLPTVHIQKAVNAVDPLQPTPAEDANDPNSPAKIIAGANVVWTYLLTGVGTTPLTVVSVVDDNGTLNDFPTTSVRSMSAVIPTATACSTQPRPGCTRRWASSPIRPRQDSTGTSVR